MDELIPTIALSKMNSFKRVWRILIYLLGIEFLKNNNKKKRFRILCKKLVLWTNYLEKFSASSEHIYAILSSGPLKSQKVGTVYTINFRTKRCDSNTRILDEVIQLRMDRQFATVKEMKRFSKYMFNSLLEVAKKTISPYTIFARRIYNTAQNIIEIEDSTAD